MGLLWLSQLHSITVTRHTLYLSTQVSSYYHLYKSACPEMRRLHISGQIMYAAAKYTYSMQRTIMGSHSYFIVTI